MTVDRKCDPTRIAIEQTDRKHLLKASDDVRHGGLSEPELVRRLGHAAAVHDREKDLQVPKFKPAADMVFGGNVSHR